MPPIVVFILGVLVGMLVLIGISALVVSSERHKVYPSIETGPGSKEEQR